jgi:hypothetical protein
VAEIDKYLDAMHTPLTEQQLIYAETYLEAFDVYAAYAAAYGKQTYGNKHQRFQLANGPLQTKAVKEYVGLRRADLREALCIDGERLAAELSACAFTNIADLVEWDEFDNVKLIPKSRMTLAQKKSIKKIKVTKTPTEHGTKTVMELEVHDKLKAIDMLQKNLGITSDKSVTNNFQNNFITLNPGDMTDEELKAVLHNASSATKENKPTTKPEALPEPQFFDQPVDVMQAQSEAILSILDED